MSELISIIIKSLIPILFLILGGQWLLTRYELVKKVKEQEIELIRSIRQQQYEAVETLYRLFAELMALFREVNYVTKDLLAPDTQKHLFLRAVKAESEVDALIFRIACEFAGGKEKKLEKLLGHLRQSVQLWRSTIRDGKRLPFYSSGQADYVRFKETFAGTAAFMVNQIHNRLEPPEIRMGEAISILIGVFSNKYEFTEYQSDISESSNET
jgi:hypothetical protein